MPSIVLNSPDEATFQDAYKLLTGHALIEGRAAKFFQTMSQNDRGVTVLGTCEIRWEGDPKTVTLIKVNHFKDILDRAENAFSSPGVTLLDSLGRNVRELKDSMQRLQNLINNITKALDGNAEYGLSYDPLFSRIAIDADINMRLIMEQVHLIDEYIPVEEYVKKWTD